MNLVHPFNERDLLDAQTYGVCRCGRPIRARLSRSFNEDGTPLAGYSWASCDEGHGTL
jgi:hypothetical protein